MSDNIQVIVRCRGRNEREIAAKSPTIIQLPNDVCSLDDPYVSVNNESPSLISPTTSGKVFKVDQVYGPNADQALLFENVALPLFLEFVNGLNVTVLAYGQTGSGKTYSMCGDIQGEHAGIIPRVLSKLFSVVTGDYFVKLSCVELYKEELRDLMSDDDGKSKLRLVSDNKKSASVQNLTEIHIDSCEMGFKILQLCLNKRKTSATKLNDLSSRSHTIFTINLYRQSKLGELLSDFCVSKMNLVDLAGSEDINKSGAVNERAREAGSINQSLLALGKVINSLSEGKEPKHIPYRESKLTRLLQGSIGGRTKTALIATISPAKINAHETLSTLNYASKAKSIKNLPQSTQDSEMVLKKVLVGELSAQIARVTRDLMATRDKEGGIKMSTQNYDQYNLNIASMASDLKEKNAEVKSLASRVEKKEEELETLRQQVRAQEQAEEEIRLQLATEKNIVSSLTLQMSAMRQKYTAQKEKLMQVMQTNIGEVSDALKGISHLIMADQSTVGGDLDTLKSELTAQVGELKATLKQKTDDIRMVLLPELSRLESLLMRKLTTASFDISHDMSREVDLVKSSSENLTRNLQSRLNPESEAFKEIVDTADLQLASQASLLKNQLLEDISKTVEAMFKANHLLIGNTLKLTAAHVLASGSQEVALEGARHTETVNSACTDITRKTTEIAEQVSSLESHLKQEIQNATKDIGVLLQATLESAVGEASASVEAVAFDKIENTIETAKKGLQRAGSTAAQNIQVATADLDKFRLLVESIEPETAHKRGPLSSPVRNHKRRKPMSPLKFENGTFRSHIPQSNHSK